MAEDLGREGLREVLVHVVAPRELLQLPRDALRGQRGVLGRIVVVHVVHEEVGVRNESGAEGFQTRVRRRKEAAWMRRSEERYR